MRQQGQFLLFSRDEFKAWLMQQHVSRTIKLIQNHHTWSPSYSGFNGANHFERLDSMKDFHVRSRGFSDIAQNLTTFPDGTIAVCRSLNIAPAGIKGANAYGICIEHFGNFDIGGDKMTDEHRKTILFVNAVLCEKFKLPINTESIVYHHWWSAEGEKVFDIKTGKKLQGSPAKSCPGTAFFGGNTVLDAQQHFIPLIKNMKAEEYMMVKDDANKLINTYLKPAWGAAEAKGDAEGKKEAKRLANELRKASGQPVQ